MQLLAFRHAGPNRPDIERRTMQVHLSESEHSDGLPKPTAIDRIDIVLECGKHYLQSDFVQRAIEGTSAADGNDSAKQERRWKQVAEAGRQRELARDTLVAHGQDLAKDLVLNNRRELAEALLGAMRYCYAVPTPGTLKEFYKRWDTLQPALQCARVELESTLTENNSTLETDSLNGTKRSKEKPKKVHTSRKLDQYALGLDEKYEWHVFKRHDRNWQHWKKIPVTQSIDELRLFLDQGGSFDRPTWIKSEIARNGTSKAKPTFTQLGTAINRLRKQLMDSIGLNDTATRLIVFKDKSYRLMIAIGHSPYDPETKQYEFEPAAKI